MSGLSNLGTIFPTGIIIWGKIRLRPNILRQVGQKDKVALVVIVTLKIKMNDLES